MQPILSVSASPLDLLLTLTFPVLRKVIFKLDLVPELWLVCTNFFAILFLHVPILYLKKCSPISLLDFFRTSSIIVLMKTPITNQFIQLLHLLLHFIPTIQPTFLKYFFISLFFVCNPKFLPQKRGHDSKKKNRRTLIGPRRPAEEPKGSIIP